MTNKDRFIVFLSLTFIFMVLVAKFAFGVNNSFFPKGKWLINQEKALAIVNERKEVKEFMGKGKSRKEDQFGIIISQPKISLEASPTAQKPFWEFHVFEDIIDIPKTGNPSSHLATLNWYQVNAYTGQIKKTF